MPLCGLRRVEGSRSVHSADPRVDWTSSFSILSTMNPNHKICVLVESPSTFDSLVTIRSDITACVVGSSRSRVNITSWKSSSWNRFNRTWYWTLTLNTVRKRSRFTITILCRWLSRSHPILSGLGSFHGVPLGNCLLSPWRLSVP